MVGCDIDPAGEPLEVARSDEIAQPIPADPEGRKVAASEHAASADCVERMAGRGESHETSRTKRL
jgi:hypothetical protein